MGSFSAEQEKYIAHFITKNNHRIQLCAFPYVYYFDRSANKEDKIHITSLQDQYKGDQEREKREKAAQKKAERAAERERVRRSKRRAMA